MKIAKRSQQATKSDPSSLGDRSQRIGNDPPLSYGDARFEPVLQSLDRLSRGSFPVLLEGEIGSGKRLTARALQRASASGPTVVVHCRRYSPQRILDDLAATIRRTRSNRCESTAHRPSSTLLLVGIEAVPPAIVPELVHLLDDFRQTAVRDSVKCIATSRDSLQQLTDGLGPAFCFHFGVGRVALPPLRQRPDDIGPMAREISRRFCWRHGLEPPNWSTDALEELTHRPWVGNVRELVYTVESASWERAGRTVRAAHLPPTLISGHDSPVQTLAELEHSAIQRALRLHNGHRNSTAKALGIGERTLYSKIRRYGLTLD